MTVEAEVVIVEDVDDSGPNPFIMFLIFVLTFIVAFVIPFLATVYSKLNARKWLFYWVNLILATVVLRPILTFIFGAYAGAFLYLVVAAGLIITSSNEKASDLLLNIINDQWENLSTRGKEIAKQYGLIE